MKSNFLGLFFCCAFLSGSLASQQDVLIPRSSAIHGDVMTLSSETDILSRLAAYRENATRNCARGKQSRLVAANVLTDALRDSSSLLEAAPSRTYGGYWMVGAGYSSVLIVRNKDADNAAKANVTLFSHNGIEEAKGEIEIAANSVARLSLGSLLQTKAESRWGSLMLEFIDGSALRTMGSVVLENETEGVIYDVPLLGGYRFDTQNAVYSNWWLPDEGTDGIVALFNISGQEIAVSPFLVTDGTEVALPSQSLASHETKKLSIRELLHISGLNQLTRGAITLRYSGPAHALDPTLMLSNSRTGFSLVSAFNAKHEDIHGERTVHWQFSNVFLAPVKDLGFDEKEELTAYVLLTNGTRAKVVPELAAEATDLNGTDAHQWPIQIKPLAPLETRLVDLSHLMHGNPKMRNVSVISLTAAHVGVPGDVAITAFSLGKHRDFVLQAQGTVRPSKAMDSSYWDISGDLTALLTVTNPSSVAVQTKAVVSYQNGSETASYTLPTINLPPTGGRVLNLKKLLLAGVPDVDGKIIPPGITFGTLTLEVADKASTGLIAGGSSTFDPHRGGYGFGAFPPNCDFCSTCEDCIQPTDTGGDCAPSCEDPSCCPPDPPPGVPDHLIVLSDVSGPLSSLGISCGPPNIQDTIFRKVQYEVLDFYDNIVPGVLSVAEQFANISVNTCLNGAPNVALACVNTASGAVFVDSQSVGCNAVGGSCGFTATNQQAVWCSGSGHVVIGTPGTLEIHNNLITINGSLHFVPGTMIF